MLPGNMANSSEKGELFEKIYEYKKKYYKVIENAKLHARLGSDPTFREVYFNDTQASEEEPADLVVVENEMMDVSKENFFWNNNNTKLLLHLYEERKDRFRDPKVKKKCLWNEIANEFKKHNYLNMTEDILDRKMRNMKKTYRTIKDNKKLSGRGRITWEYFEIMENIFFDDKTINFGLTLSSMQPTVEPHSKKIAKQLDRNQKAVFDCELVNVSFLQKTPHNKLLSKDSTSCKKHMPQNFRSLRDQRLYLTLRSPSTDSMSSIDSKFLYDPHDSISTEEDDLNDTQPQNRNLSEVDMYKYDAPYGVDDSLQSDEDSEKDKYNKDTESTTSKCKPYSMKDGAVRSRAMYKRRRIDEEREMERTKEITELRKTFEKNNEI